MRLLVVVVALAGCRIDFDPVAATSDALGVDAPTIDAGPLALACNTPVALSTATAANPHLTAAARGATLIAIWLDDAGHAVSQPAQLTSPTTVQPLGVTTDPTNAWSMVSAAISGTTLMVALANPDNGSTRTSSLHPFDATTGQSAGAPMISTVWVVSPRGLVALNGGFWLGGIAFNPTAGADVVRLSAAGTATSSVTRVIDAAATARTAALADGGTTVIVATSPSLPCTARLAASGALGPTAFWGATSMCVQPIAIPAATGRSILLVRKDTSDGNLNHQIATAQAGLTLSLPGEGKLANVADEPRGVAIGSGFWVAYHTPAGMLEAVAVDSGSTIGTPHVLGPTAALDAHDVLAINGEPYAVWFANGLQIAHLCP